MTKIGIVILNYNSLEDTVHCVDDFKKQMYENDIYYIVIVDNASTDRSYDILKNRFAPDKNVSVVKTKANLGFARGNNFGYEYLKSKGSFDFFVFSNSDIELPYFGLVSWIERLKSETSFAVLGPSVFWKSGKKYQSPSYNSSRNILEQKFIIERFDKLAQQKEANVIDRIFKLDGSVLYGSRSDKYTLFGAFLIFSKIYFDHYSDPFDPRTFMYGEENILKLRCDYKSLKMVYDPDYIVVHAQSGSVSKLENIKENEFRLKNQKKAIEAYISVLIDFGYGNSDLTDLQQEMVAYALKKNYSYAFWDLNSYLSKKVIIYGAGKVGRDLYKQIMDNGNESIIAWVDKNKDVRDKYKKQGVSVEKIESVLSLDFDYLLVAVKHKELFDTIKSELLQTGIAPQKIVWMKNICLNFAD